MSKSHISISQWSIGDWIAVLTLLGGLIYTFASIRMQLADLPQLEKRTERIEHYLSSRDPAYWQITKQQN